MIFSGRFAAIVSLIKTVWLYKHYPQTFKSHCISCCLFPANKSYSHIPQTIDHSTQGLKVQRQVCFQRKYVVHSCVFLPTLVLFLFTVQYCFYLLFFVSYLSFYPIVKSPLCLHETYRSSACLFEFTVTSKFIYVVHVLVFQNIVL